MFFREKITHKEGTLLKHKLTAFLMALCLVITLFSGCSKNEADVTLPMAVAPSSYDPVIAEGADISSIANNIYEGLVRIDENGNVQPAVADHWNVTDGGLTYTFTLKGDSRWHLPTKPDESVKDKNFNVAVTADDFEFALKRAVSPDTKAPGASKLFSIRNAEAINKGDARPSTLGVEAKGDNTLVIRLSQPDTNFLAALALPVAMPCNQKFFEATLGRYALDPTLILTNGPYYLASTSLSGGSLTLAKSDDYVGNFEARAEKVKFVKAIENSVVEVKDEDKGGSGNTASSALNIVDELNDDKGSIDAATISMDGANLIKSKVDITKYDSAVKAICFNQNSVFGSCAPLRKAFASAIDASRFADGNNGAKGVVADATLGTFGENYRQSAGRTKPLPYSLGNSRKYIEEATNALQSFADSDKEDNFEFSGTFNVKLLCLSDDKAFVQSLVQSWQKAFGTTLSIEISTYDTESDLKQAISYGSYDIAYATVESDDYLALNVLRGFTGSSDTNIINLKDEYFNSLVEDAAKTEKGSISKSTKKAEQYLINEAYFIPVENVQTAFVYKKSVKGLTVLPNGNTFALYNIGK